MNRTLVIVAQSARRVLDDQLSRLERLRAEGFDVQIATPFSPALDELAGHGFDTRPLPGADAWNLPGRAAAYPILQGEWLQSPPLLVHGFESSWAYVAALAGHRAGVPAVFVTKSCHDLSHPIRRRAYRKLGQWATSYVLHHEADLHGLTGIVPAAKLDLLLGGYGIDLTVYDPDSEDLVPVTRPPERVVVAARDDARTQEIMAAVRRRHPNVGWLLFDGIPPAALLAGSDLLLEADPHDHTGFSLMAGAAMRLPCVAADSRAAQTCISDHETGRIATASKLATVVGELVGNPKRARDMGVRARARAERRFDRRQIDEQLLTIYDRALSERIS